MSEQYPMLTKEETWRVLEKEMGRSIVTFYDRRLANAAYELGVKDSASQAERIKHLEAHIQEAAQPKSFYGSGPSGWQSARDWHLAALKPQEKNDG